MSLPVFLILLFCIVSYLAMGVVLFIFYTTGDMVVELDDESNEVVVPKSKRVRAMEVFVYIWCWVFSPLLVLIAIGYFIGKGVHYIFMHR